MKNQNVATFKNQIVVAFIVVGAIIFAIPICIFGLIRLAWVVGKSLALESALGRQPVSKKLRHLAETIEGHISGGTRE